MDKPDFIRINKYVEGGFTDSNLENINVIMNIDKDIIIAYFHNFFSAYKENSPQELDRLSKKENLKEADRNAVNAFKSLSENLSWSVCRNIVSFVENYSRPERW